MLSPACELIANNAYLAVYSSWCFDAGWGEPLQCPPGFPPAVQLPEMAWHLQAQSRPRVQLLLLGVWGGTEKPVTLNMVIWLGSLAGCPWSLSIKVKKYLLGYDRNAIYIKEVRVGVGKDLVDSALETIVNAIYHTPLTYISLTSAILFIFNSSAFGCIFFLFYAAFD